MIAYDTNIKLIPWWPFLFIAATAILSFGATGILIVSRSECFEYSLCAGFGGATLFIQALWGLIFYRVGNPVQSQDNIVMPYCSMLALKVLSIAMDVCLALLFQDPYEAILFWTVVGILATDFVGLLFMIGMCAYLRIRV